MRNMLCGRSDVKSILQFPTQSTPQKYSKLQVHWNQGVEGLSVDLNGTSSNSDDIATNHPVSCRELTGGNPHSKTCSAFLLFRVSVTFLCSEVCILQVVVHAYVGSFLHCSYSYSGIAIRIPNIFENFYAYPTCHIMCWLLTNTARIHPVGFTAPRVWEYALTHRFPSDVNSLRIWMSGHAGTLKILSRG